MTTTVSKNTQIGMEVNAMAKVLINQITFEGSKILFSNSKSQALYNELGEKVMNYVMKQARVFKLHFEAKAQIEFDFDTLVSIGMCEGLLKALSRWDVEKADFLVSLKYHLKTSFLDYMKEELTDKRKTAYNSASYTVSDDEGNETDYMDTIEDTKSSPETIDQMLMLKELFTQLSQEEQGLLVVLMENTGKSRGEAVAKFFGKDSYDSALRKRVSRFQAKCAELIG